MFTFCKTLTACVSDPDVDIATKIGGLVNLASLSKSTKFFRDISKIEGAGAF